ncbi:MAG: hypothetical protein J7J31_02695 [Helicobacteraceae bacterium]|nr:hypothetical protein [Helicobacteraceae bacterium]
MKYIFISLVMVASLMGAKVTEIGDRFKDSSQCKACHVHLVKDWESSWHAKSHYQNDEYFRASIEYVSRKTRKSLNGVKVQCATCHNPRISVTSTGMDYEIMAVMNLDKDSKVNKALQSDAIDEGINCVVCHNIDKIHADRDESFRGINRIEWTKSGVMTGPYEDARSPYHKVEHRDFMDEKSDQLCFVCHANDRSVSDFVFTDMHSEYKKGEKGCVDCHMGEKRKGYASTYKIDNGKAKQRDIRSHGFIGAHTETLWKDALRLAIWQKKEETVLSISNPQPHNIPSGFGSRELVVDVIYKKDSSILDTKTLSLTRHYTDKREKPTIPHLAVEASKDMSIPANGKRILKVENVPGANRVEVILSYRLVNDEVHSLLKLKEPIWSQKFFITSKTIKLK